MYDSIYNSCAINDNHMVYGSWDTERDGQNFLSFWTAFCTFTHLTTQKIKILKKWKNAWRYYFTHVYLKWQSYDVWLLKYEAWWTFFFCHSGPFFLPFYHLPLTTQQIKISKNWKKILMVSSFYICEPKIRSRWCMVPEIWCPTDGRTDRRMEKVTYRGCATT